MERRDTERRDTERRDTERRVTERRVTGRIDSRAGSSPAGKRPDRAPLLGGSRLIACSLALLAMLTACTDPRDRSSRPLLLVSVAPQAFFLERLAGDLVEIEVLIPPGASPATFAPTTKQMQAAFQARLFIKVGHPNFPFERAWLDELTEQNPTLRIVDGSRLISLREGDPHLWVSPKCVRRMCETMTEALIGLFPEERALLESNLHSFSAEIDRLDAEIREQLADHAGAKFLVFHPAWGYFAEEYGLIQISVEHEHKEPGPAHLQRVLEIAREEGIRVVFAQPQFPSESAELVAREIGGRVVFLDSLARNWPENMRRIATLFAEAFEQ
jgi:zinc transport system substrate-binding protein